MLAQLVMLPVTYRFVLLVMALVIPMLLAKEILPVQFAMLRAMPQLVTRVMLFVTLKRVDVMQ